MSVRSSKKKSSQPLTPAPSVLDAVNASRGPRVFEVEATAAERAVEAPDVAEHVEPQDAEPQVAAPQVVEPVVAEVPRPVAPQASVDASSVDDLGHYVTRVMVDARRAASEFLASVDVDAHRRAATIAGQAEIEARSLREAARADADKIRADARLEADRLVAQRLRIAIDLTDQLYRKAEQILADADRPDEARRHLAQLVTALTQTVEDAAEASLADARA